MEEKKVSWLELFFDLVFVSAVSFTTRILVNADHDPQLLRVYFGEFLLMVFPMFWLWASQTMFFNRYSERLHLPMLFMLPQMFCLIFMTTSLNFGFTHIYQNFLLGYLGFRLLTIIQYYIAARRSPKNTQRRSARLLAYIFTIGIIITALSLFCDAKWRYAVMYTGIFIDILLPLFFGKILARTPVNLPHLVERLGAFVIIAFGESLVSIADIMLSESAAGHALVFAASGFLLISLMWLSYFYDFGHRLDLGYQTNGQLLLYGHFFILAAIMIIAADLHMLYAAVLPEPVLIEFLFGAALVFFAFKHWLFFKHRKQDIQYNFKKILVVFVLISVSFVFCLIFQPRAIVALLLLSLCFAVEIGFQLHLPQKLRRHFLQA